VRVLLDESLPHDLAAELRNHQNIPFQQNVAALKVGVVVIRAASSRMADLLPLIPALLAALDGIRPGELRRVGA